MKVRGSAVDLFTLLSILHYARNTQCHDELYLSCEVLTKIESNLGGCSGCSNSLKRLTDRANSLRYTACKCKTYTGGGTSVGGSGPGTVSKGIGGGGWAGIDKGWGGPGGPGGTGGVGTGTKDCDTLYREGTTEDGVYVVPINGKETEIYCEFNKNGYNWLVFLRRQNGYLDFYRDWDEYEKGFGDAVNEYWIGLQNLHHLTKLKRYILRVDVQDFSYRPKNAYAEYQEFSLGDSKSFYTLTVNGYSGTAGDSMAYSNNRPFTTKDVDNDIAPYNCAFRHHGAWWYKRCHDANLMGEYYLGGKSNDKGVNWWYWKDNYYSMRKASMKIRPR